MPTVLFKERKRRGSAAPSFLEDGRLVDRSFGSAREMLGRAEGVQHGTPSFASPSTTITQLIPTMLLPVVLAAAALAPSALALDGFGVGMPHQVAAFINLLEHGAEVPPDGGLQGDAAAFVVQADGCVGPIAYFERSPRADCLSLSSCLLLASCSVPLPFKPSTHDAHCFRQPVSHFADAAVDSHHADTFCQRYWYDASDYKAGGPVFVIDGGETSGANRLPFLDTGIVKRLAQEFDGLALILEHRYYGESFPYWPNGNLSTDSLRFLNNAEALEDSADFIRHLNIKGLGHDVRGGREGGAKWIYIGGSYAGARAAHMRCAFHPLCVPGV
jgi:hypothetical protein